MDTAEFYKGSWLAAKRINHHPFPFEEVAMWKYLSALIASFLLVGIGLAQAEKKKPPGPNEVEVRLTDGSRVRMTILQESIEVVTKYGKLTVPTLDIRKIEFGIHPLPEVRIKIDEAIKRLGDESFKLREDASKDLLGLGAPAYFALSRAAKSTDAEVAKRAKGLLEKIREKIPENQMRIKEDDLIQTADFSIVGQVAATTIKAKTAIFGEAQLKVTDMRGINWMGVVGEVEVTIDGATYARGANQWMDTGVEVSPDEELVIAASGQLDFMSNNPGQQVTGPNGNGNWGRQGPHVPGALLGKIGETGAVFVIGEKYNGTPKKEGKLFLGIGTSPWANNGWPITGSYNVKITGGKETGDRK